MNILGILYLIEILLDAQVKFPQEKIIVGLIAFCSWGWAYWYYELAGKGKGVIASFYKLKNKRRNAVIGGIIFFEMFLIVMLPGIIAVIRNPMPR